MPTTTFCSYWRYQRLMYWTRRAGSGSHGVLTWRCLCLEVDITSLPPQLRWSLACKRRACIRPSLGDLLIQSGHKFYSVRVVGQGSPLCLFVVCLLASFFFSSVYFSAFVSVSNPSRSRWLSSRAPLFSVSCWTSPHLKLGLLCLNTYYTPIATYAGTLSQILTLFSVKP